MNRQPYHTPPRWWSPHPSPFWIRLWRPLRQRRGLREHGLSGVEVRGLEHLAAASAQDQGVLITPNHSSHADAFVLLETADQLGAPFFYMTAWQVFGMTHSLGRRVLRQHGCFSVNREGHDLRAVRCAVDVLAHGQQPLVIFPEGEVFHLNDRLMPFRRGAATTALLAARRGQRPVACVPCAVKFQFVNDPTPNLLQLAARLEERLHGKQRPALSLDRRINGMIGAIVAAHEVEHLGMRQRGDLSGRAERLITDLLARLECQYQLPASSKPVPERVKRLRFHIIQQQEGAAHDCTQSSSYDQDLHKLFQVMQLYSYPIDYLTDSPPLERLAETLDKLEEDVLGVRTAGIRGLRRSIVTFGQPIIVQPEPVAKGTAEVLTQRLQLAVERLLGQTKETPPGWASPPVDSQPIAPPTFDMSFPHEHQSFPCLPAH